MTSNPQLAHLNEVAGKRPAKDDDFVRSVLQIVKEMKREKGKQEPQKITEMVDNLILTNKHRLIHKKKIPKDKKVAKVAVIKKEDSPIKQADVKKLLSFPIQYVEFKPFEIKSDKSSCYSDLPLSYANTFPSQPPSNIASFTKSLMACVSPKYPSLNKTF